MFLKYCGIISHSLLILTYAHIQLLMELSEKFFLKISRGNYIPNLEKIGPKLVTSPQMDGQSEYRRV